MTAQPADDQVKSVVPKRSQKMLRWIKYARVTRDLILCIGGIVLAVLTFVIPVPAYAGGNDQIWIFSLIFALAFGIAALVHGKSEWKRDMSRSVRYTCSIIFMVVGAYLVVYALDTSGYIGMRGSGVATNCQYLEDNGGGSSTHSYACDVAVHWSNGTITHEHLDSAPRIDNGEEIMYVSSPKTGLLRLFSLGDQTLNAWPDAWFALMTGLAIFLQSFYVLCLAIFTGRRKTT